MVKIKNISYDGKYPNLCRGCLTIDLSGHDEIAAIELDYLLTSGGECYITDNWSREVINKGKWNFDWNNVIVSCIDHNDQEIKAPRYGLFLIFDNKLKDEIENWVQDNVPQGCCGGCN